MIRIKIGLKNVNGFQVFHIKITF